MKRLQENPIGKLIAVALLICTVFAGASFGTKALQASYLLGSEDYRETEVFYTLLRQRLNDIATAFAMNERLKDAELDYVLRAHLEDEIQALRDGFDSANSNLRFIVRDENGEVLFDLMHDNGQYDGTIFYADFVLGEHLVNHFSGGALGWSYYEDETPVEDAVILEYSPTYTIECTVLSPEQLDTDGVHDEFYELYIQYRSYTENFYHWINSAAWCLGIALLCLLYILWTAGHKAGEGVVLTWQERIYFDVYLFVMIMAGTLVFALLFYLLEETLWNFSVRWRLDITQGQNLTSVFRMGASALCVVFVGIVTLTLRTFVVRLKLRALARSTLLCRVLIWLWKCFKELLEAGKAFVLALPILWRLIAVCLLYFFVGVTLYNMTRYSSFAGLSWCVLNIAAFLLLCWWALGFRRLSQGCAAIAAGNLSHQIDESRLPYDLKQHAQQLNSISGGLQTAVNEQMKSERFKAELITNVSHDLKTPLTSIINYVELLKHTEQTDPKAEEYIEVLDRKAQRLKKLTEDLVEASKASTGTLNINREKIGMSQLIDQALGEYEEKLESRRLTVIISLPEDETYVHADGRHLWRVIDNLLSNCCKYAMEGTRVYLELTRGKGQVALSVKNISREPLNIPPERLMERFVRGEESRSTEGSGLGLSIARSLTELQGGSFELAVDGDLFKAIVTMPQAG